MLLLSTSSLPHYGLERVFEFAKEAGFDGIEICITPENYDTQNHEYLKRLVDRVGIEIKAFSLADKAEDEAAMEAFHYTVREFTETTIVLNPPKALNFKYKNWLNDLVPRLAQKYNLTFCRRNTPSKNILGLLPERSDSSIYALKEQGDVCLDLTALAQSNEEIMKAISFLGSNMRHVYLSNVRRGLPYALPQNGVLPVESFLTKLAQVKYKGHFSLKVDSKQLMEGDDDKLRARLKDCKEFYDKYFLNAESNKGV